MQANSYLQLFRRAVLSSYFVLLLALGVLLGPHATSSTGAIVLVIVLLPLLAAMRGLVAGSLYTHRWASLLVIAYMAYGLVEVIANPSMRYGAIAILFISFLLFSSLLGYIRAAPQQ